MQGHEEKVHNNRSLLEQVGRRKGTPDPEFSHNELCIMQFQQTKHNTALQAKFSNYNTHSSKKGDVSTREWITGGAPWLPNRQIGI